MREKTLGKTTMDIYASDSGGNYESTEIEGAASEGCLIGVLKETIIDK